MNDLTDKEAAVLDKYYTTHIPKVGPNEGGFFANRTRCLMPVDDLSAAYIRAACEAEHNPPIRAVQGAISTILPQQPLPAHAKTYQNR